MINPVEDLTSEDRKQVLLTLNHKYKSYHNAMGEFGGILGPIT